MSELSLNQALRALLLAQGIADDDGIATPDVPTLTEYLGGHGFELRSLALLDPVVPREELQIGCLLALPDGQYLPILGGGEEAILLQEDGNALRLVVASDVAQATHALVISEPLANASRVLSYLHRHKGKLLEILACGVMINLFGLALPLFSSFVYDKILGNGITSTLWALVIGLGLIAVVEFSLRIIRIIVAERIARLSDAEIDHRVFRNLLDAKANALPSIGSILEKYKQLISYRDFLSSAYMLALVDLPFLLLYAVAITLAAGPLVLVGLTCGTLMVLGNLLFTLPSFDYERKARRASEVRLGVMTDLMTARDAVVGASLRDQLARKWRAASLSATHALSMGRYWRGFAQTVTNSLSFISYAAVLVGGAYMIESHDLTSGGLLAASLLTARMLGNFTSASTLITRYHEFRTALSELNKIFPATQDEKPITPQGALRGTVRFDRVTCRLGHGSNPVLQNVSLTVQPGEMVGIAGAPGGGKTTLLRLIAGLLQPDEGQVMIDDMPLDRIALEDISSTIGYKPQDLCVMDGTILDNIRAGRGPLDAEVRQALLELTGLGHAFQENGLNWLTNVGPRGSNLSGGQRQLVALARALVGRPPLLLLDEPSNGLDAPLELHIAEQLRRMKGQSTILISTHSRNLLSICDRIIVVGQSRLLADGPRDKILV